MGSSPSDYFEPKSARLLSQSFPKNIYNTNFKWEGKLTDVNWCVILTPLNP